MLVNLGPKDVIHVPKASKNPIYVHKLPTNNNVSQISPEDFLHLCKENVDVAYTIFHVVHFACGTMKPSSNTWLNHLGQASFFHCSSEHWLEYIYTSEQRKHSIFDACQRAIIAISYMYQCLDCLA